jgi:alpha-L-fucosidase
MGQNGSAIYGADKLANAPWHPYATYTSKGNTLYMGIYAWPGDTPAERSLQFYRPPVVFAIGGFRTKVQSIRLMKTEQTMQFTQDEITLRINGLPATSPDELIAVLELKCEGIPVIDHEYVRKARPR